MDGTGGDDAMPIGSVVRVEWGEPVEEVTAVVHRWTADGVVVSLVPDLTQLDGHVWLAARAVRAVERLPDDSAVVRHLRAVGVRREADQVEHGSAAAVLGAAAATGELIWVQDVEDGSDAASVGRVLDLDGERVVLAAVDADGRADGELVRPLAGLTRLEWGTAYLRALTVLGGGDEGGAGPG